MISVLAREAVNTFGDFHYWFSRDPMRCRILVYVTYSSAKLVPRDVVFRQPLVGRFTGIRRSWTAPVYVLTSEFADVIPANEDPMPANANAHPLPGHLIPDNNPFVLPEYPAMGWNEVHVPAHHNHHAEPQEQHGVQQEMPEEHVDDASDISTASLGGNPVPVVMMKEPVEPPREVLGQADQLVQQLHEEAIPMEPVHEEQQENNGYHVDVLMEFVLEEEQMLPANAEVDAQENAVLLQEDNSDVATAVSVAALSHPSSSEVVA
jgi:hypothetical protein